MIWTRADKVAACITCRYPVILILTMRGIVVYRDRDVHTTSNCLSVAIHKAAGPALCEDE